MLNELRITAERLSYAPSVATVGTVDRFTPPKRPHAKDVMFASMPRKLPLCLISAYLLGLGGCSDYGAEKPNGSQVVIAVATDLDKPFPLLTVTDFDTHINSMLYMSLLAKRWENGALVYQTADRDPTALARSYEFFGPDSASLRYRLRSDVRWSDGRPVTARDAVWTLQTQGEKRVASARFGFNREVRSIAVEDDSTFVIHFNRRYPEMFFHTAGEVMPRHVFEGVELSHLRSHQSINTPVGRLVTSGPFRLAEWIRGQRIVLEANPQFQPRPRLDRIVFRIIPDANSRLVELQTGTIDMVQVPFDRVTAIRRLAGVRIEKQEMRATESIQYNPLAYEYLANSEIRRALGLAIDKENMVSRLNMDGFATVAGGPYAPSYRHLYDAHEQAPLPYDTAEARRILAANGWKRGTDGILHKSGVRFRITLLINHDNQRRFDSAQIVESHWRALGVEVRIQTLDLNTVVERMTAREFEARIGGWNVAVSADLHQFWGDRELPHNYVSYDNPRVQRLFAQAAQVATLEEAAPYLREAAAIIVADQPYTWLFFSDTPFAIRNRFQGVRLDTLSPYQNPWEWYVEN